MPGAEVMVGGKVLTWEDAPGAAGAAAGLGCAALLVLFAVAGAVAAVEQGEPGSLVGVPFVLLFAAAAVVLGLGRTRVEVDARAGELRRRNTLLGLTVRRSTVPIGQPEAVRVQPLAAGGRTLHRVQLCGEPDIDVIATTDPGQAAIRAQELAALLELPLR